MSPKNDRLGRNPFEKKPAAVRAPQPVTPEPVLAFVESAEPEMDPGFTPEFFYRDLPAAAAMLAIRGAFSLLNRQ